MKPNQVSDSSLLERFVKVCPEEWELRGPVNDAGLYYIKPHSFHSLGLLIDSDHFSAEALILILDHLESLGYHPLQTVAACTYDGWGRCAYRCVLLAAPFFPHEAIRGGYCKTRIEAVVTAFVDAMEAQSGGEDGLKMQFSEENAKNTEAAG